MKIDNHKIVSNWIKGVQPTKVNDVQGTATNSVNSVKDTVTLSQDAIDMNRFLEMIPEEEVRYDKVDELKRQMDNGTYNVTGKDVVMKLLEGKGYGTETP